MLLREVFELQTWEDFLLRLRWIPTEQNLEIYRILRPQDAEFVRLPVDAFVELWHHFGGFERRFDRH